VFKLKNEIENEYMDSRICAVKYNHKGRLVLQVAQLNTSTTEGL